MQSLVDEGRLGMKSGQGFRSWTEEEAAGVRTRVGAHLQKLEKILND